MYICTYTHNSLSLYKAGAPPPGPSIRPERANNTNANTNIH